MSSVAETFPEVSGLSSTSIPQLQKEYGKNEFKARENFRALNLVLSLIKEPMSLLLIVACSLYFILGQQAEGWMTLIAILIVFAIGLYQEVRSSKAIAALKQMSAPEVMVIRDGKQLVIQVRELVPGDIMLLAEGNKVPADGTIIHANDLTVNESVLTGESVPVTKGSSTEDKKIFHGTLINSGSCLVMVTETGSNTRLVKIGRFIEGYSSDKTILQAQVNRLVNKLALFGLFAFALIFTINYLHYHTLSTSLLFALTLAMSAIPEEIPVAFTSFMALGAYKMSRLGIISRQPQIIENLGCVDVLCLDKTGTITENRMTVKTVYNHRTKSFAQLEDNFRDADELLLSAVLASESQPFDAMEKAIVNAYLKMPDPSKWRNMQMSYEYPLEGAFPMMTHVYTTNGETIVAGKGAPERILDVCHLTGTDRRHIEQQVAALAAEGFRVLGVASAGHEGQLPSKQDDFAWQFEGLVALYDPPKENLPQVISSLYAAKVNIKLLTGDFADTAIAIARQVGISQPAFCYTGEQIMAMNTEELRAAIKTVNVFARMFPEAKLKVVRQLREDGHVVAMTGDGVNDAPALKVADIGIAMGKKGTEMAQQAADLVITDDNLDKINIAVMEGRKIFHNLVKAVRYIIAIHIPIILTASIPLILGWKFPNIFTPVHIIFLELIMGPTCSVFFEREPAEQLNTENGPRKKTSPFLTRNDVLISITQGLIIAFGVLGLYYYCMRSGYDLEQTRTAVFTTLILANIFLTFIARSYSKTIFTTIRYKNPLVVPVLAGSCGFLVLLLLFAPARDLFGLAIISPALFLGCFAVAFVCVCWFEIYKSNLPQQPYQAMRPATHKDRL